MACADRYVPPYWGPYEYRRAFLQSAFERRYQNATHRERGKLFRAHVRSHDAARRWHWPTTSANRRPEPVPEVHAPRAVSVWGRVLGARHAQGEGAAALTHSVVCWELVERVHAGGAEEGRAGRTGRGVPPPTEQCRSAAGRERRMAGSATTAGPVDERYHCRA